MRRFYLIATVFLMVAILIGLAWIRDPAQPVGWALDAMMRSAFSANVPMKLYGKVVDQAGTAVPDAHVTYSIAYESLSWRDPPKGTVVAGADGTFTIKGGKGVGLTIESIEKQRYEFKPSASDSVYFHDDPGRGAVMYQPDPARPLVFHLWRTGEKAALLHGEQRCYFNPDGRSYSIDFKSGDCAEEAAGPGDLRVSVVGDPGYTARLPHTRSDWKVTLSSDGGLLPVNDAFGYEAPNSGYLPSWSIGFSRDDAAWRPGIDEVRLYVHAHGLYGRLELGVYPFYGTQSQGMITTNYWINPTGSRNLEEDPAGRLRPLHESD